MRNCPVFIGMKVMFNGVFAFGCFAAAAYNAWKIAAAIGWIAVLHFLLFGAFAAYGIWCLYRLGMYTMHCKICE